MDIFTRQYIITALWSSMDNSDDQGGEPLDANFGLDDIAAETLASITEDCEAFQRDNADDIGNDGEQAGHDFWLTRNHHEPDFGTATGCTTQASDLPKRHTFTAASTSTLATTAFSTGRPAGK